MKILRSTAALVALASAMPACSDIDAPLDEDSPDIVAVRAAEHATALARELPEVAITEMRAEGDCASSAIVADGRVGEVRWSRFEAALRGTSAASAQCDLRVSVATPAGHAYALEELSVEGAVTLAAQSTARLEADYHFGEAAPVASRAKEFLGPVDGPLAFFADFADGDRAFSDCRTASDLTVRLRLSVQSVDPNEGSIAVTRFRPLRIAVRPCPAPAKP